MIQTVRLDANSFIGKDHEDIVWEQIKYAKEKCVNEFQVCFSITEGSTAMVKKVAAVAQSHLEALQLKTTIKLWENCKKDFIFLDVYQNNNHTNDRNFRFSCRGEAPYNIIQGFTFLIDHYQFIRSQDHDHFTRGKKQKRNDSTNHDYNKK